MYIYIDIYIYKSRKNEEAVFSDWLALLGVLRHTEFFKALSLENIRYHSWHTKHHWNDLVDGVITPAIKVMISKIWVCSKMGTLRIAKTS